MIGQIKGRWNRRLGERRRRKWKRERMQRRRKKKSRAKAHGLEKPQVLRGLIDVEDGSVVVDLPNLGTQHVIILTVLCFHCRGAAYLGGDLLQHSGSVSTRLTRGYISFIENKQTNRQTDKKTTLSL